MLISEFIRELYDFTENTPSFYEKTCDTLKVGDPGRELTKVAVTMFATPEVIRQAAAWGANLILVHEPLFYDHMDDPVRRSEHTGLMRRIIDAKTKLIEDCGITIFRFHDHPHRAAEDWISLGEVKFWGLEGRWIKGRSYAVNHFELAEPMTASALAETLEKNLSIRRIRIAGDPDAVCRKLGLCFGTPGHLMEEMEGCDAVLTGEICEWAQGEPVRDMAELALEKKALLVMSHIGSERDGMRLTAERICEHFPGIEARYFECGEVYRR